MFSSYHVFRGIFEDFKVINDSNRAFGSKTGYSRILLNIILLLISSNGSS